MPNFTITEAAACIRAGSLKMEWEKPKKDEDHVKRINLFLNNGKRRENCELLAKPHTGSSFRLSGTVSNPNNPEDAMVKINYVNKSTDPKDNNLSVSTSASRCDPDLLLVLDFLDENAKRCYLEALAKGGIFRGTRQTVETFKKTTYSDSKLVDKAKQGTQREDPAYYFKMNFNKYSDKHFKPALRGKQITRVEDATKPTVKAGQVYFAPAVAEDGQPLNKFNSHQFMTMGSTVHGGYYNAASVVESKMGTNFKIELQQTIVQKAAEGSESDSLVSVAELPTDIVGATTSNLVEVETNVVNDL